MLVDTHCHLASPPLCANTPLWIKQAQQKGVTKIIVPSTGHSDFEHVLALTQKNKIYPALGIHPLFIRPNHWQSDLCDLEKRVSTNKVIAIGEIGLDFYNPNLTAQQKELQIMVFCHQLQLAQKYRLPVLLHNRKSLDKTISLLKKRTTITGIAHAFSGSLEQANELLKLNFKLGIGTMLCRDNTPKLSKLASSLPDKAFVLETDAPDMPPTPNTTNYPENVILVAQKLAKLRAQSLREIASISSKNVNDVLKIDSFDNVL